MVLRVAATNVIVGVVFVAVVVVVVVVVVIIVNNIRKWSSRRKRFGRRIGINVPVILGFVKAARAGRKLERCLFSGRGATSGR